MVFFDTQSRTPHKAPDGIVGDSDAATGKFRRQAAHRQVGLALQPRQQPLPGLTREQRAAMTADLAR
jgi:hypothetical protein